MSRLSTCQRASGAFPHPEPLSIALLGRSRGAAPTASAKSQDTHIHLAIWANFCKIERALVMPPSSLHPRRSLSGRYAPMARLGVADQVRRFLEKHLQEKLGLGFEPWVTLASMVRAAPPAQRCPHRPYPSPALQPSCYARNRRAPSLPCLRARFCPGGLFKGAARSWQIPAQPTTDEA